ncbi:ribonuclease T2 [Halovulum dunhuangense]|uniref:Ribonuclease T2 n=1 Tax=Halovulum dunhuangense TaxID=1505036 RepID=A0A849L0A4_9RHOB|nr:ribonuclease T2 [Halovulum dunhuangense]NNU79696.1 ribonuclease T2 [Halovulum dunhuangense]
MRATFIALALLFGATGTTAQDRAGDFAYYVLALSWSPAWCAAEGDGRDAAQCDPGRGHGFTLHGLWPQHERGWPEFCRSAARNPSRAETGAMADIMGSGGLAWYQWQKHGRCTGLDARAYFDASRTAYEAVALPEVFERLPRRITAPPEVVEEAFLEANPQLSPDGVTVTCRDGLLREVRICLTRDLGPRDCAADVRRDCSAPRVAVPPIR